MQRTHTCPANVTAIVEPYPEANNPRDQATVAELNSKSVINKNMLCKHFPLPSQGTFQSETRIV